MVRPLRSVAWLALLAAPAAAQDSARVASWVPPLAELMERPASELAELARRVSADRSDLLRRYEVEYSPAQLRVLRQFAQAWRARLAELPFDRLSQAGKVDYVLLDTRLRRDVAELTRDAERFREMAPLLPYAVPIMELQERRKAMETPDPAALGRALDAIARQARAATRALDSGPRPSRIVGLRAAQTVTGLREGLRRWYEFYAGYDPLFTWWSKAPYEQAADALQRHARALREKLVGWREGEEEPIVGDPIGRAALVEDLGFELIPYGPEDLVKIAEREFAWCEAELRKATRAMGLGEDWKAAIEKVKNLHVAPGKQTDLVRDLAREAEQFVISRNLVSVPPLAQDDWWMEMLSPERQRVSPFFLGGALIQVSYPTDAMSEEDKAMSMRGNNQHFSRATVQHELIPGHHLQWFMTGRHNTHRDLFGTPFWGEGWALYWEMLLWDLDFPRSPEDRVGMLFWRMHRAARIIFSLNFHLGTMSPQQAIDFLVDRVGHERANASAEVRRSFNGSYAPLYQIAYMIGGLQFRALHGELVGSGRTTARAFHDAILRQGSMPVEMVRALLVNAPLRRDHRPEWRFAGTLP